MPIYSSNHVAEKPSNKLNLLVSQSVSQFLPNYISLIILLTMTKHYKSLTKIPQITNSPEEEEKEQKTLTVTIDNGDQKLQIVLCLLYKIPVLGWGEENGRRRKKENRKHEKIGIHWKTHLTPFENWSQKHLGRLNPSPANLIVVVFVHLGSL